MTIPRKISSTWTDDTHYKAHSEPSHAVRTGQGKSRTKKTFTKLMHMTHIMPTSGTSPTVSLTDLQMSELAIVPYKAILRNAYKTCVSMCARPCRLCLLPSANFLFIVFWGRLSAYQASKRRLGAAMTARRSWRKVQSSSDAFGSPQLL